jgi:hypothetical protein
VHAQNSEGRENLEIFAPVPAQKPILHKNLSGLGIGLPMKMGPAHPDAASGTE